jgi:hypothetical protein
VQNVKRTHGSEGATEPGRPTLPIPVSVRPPFLKREDDANLSMCRRRHSQREREREPLTREAIHKLVRKERREIIHEEDHST